MLVFRFVARNTVEERMVQVGACCAGPVGRRAVQVAVKSTPPVRVLWRATQWRSAWCRWAPAGLLCVCSCVLCPPLCWPSCEAMWQCGASCAGRGDIKAPCVPPAPKEWHHLHSLAMPQTCCSFLRRSPFPSFSRSAPNPSWCWRRWWCASCGTSPRRSDSPPQSFRQAAGKLPEGYWWWQGRLLQPAISLQRHYPCRSPRFKHTMSICCRTTLQDLIRFGAADLFTEEQQGEERPSAGKQHVDVLPTWHGRHLHAALCPK